MRALSIRQPHAEAIMRGVKTIEYRSRATRIRGRIYIYASLGRYSSDEEAEMLGEYGIDDVGVNDLRRGVIIGYDSIWRSFEHGRFKARHFRLIKEGGFDSVRINLHPFGHMDPDAENALSRSWLKVLDWAVE